MYTLQNSSKLTWELHTDMVLFRFSPNLFIRTTQAKDLQISIPCQITLCRMKFPELNYIIYAFNSFIDLAFFFTSTFGFEFFSGWFSPK